MTNRWMILVQARNKAFVKEMLEKLQKQFPSFKFRVGKARKHSMMRHLPFLMTPIQGLMPSPHPNKPTEEVLEKCGAFWKECSVNNHPYEA